MYCSGLRYMYFKKTKVWEGFDPRTLCSAGEHSMHFATESPQVVNLTSFITWRLSWCQVPLFFSWYFRCLRFSLILFNLQILKLNQSFFLFKLFILRKYCFQKLLNSKCLTADDRHSLRSNNRRFVVPALRNNLPF